VGARDHGAAGLDRLLVRAGDMIVGIVLLVLLVVAFVWWAMLYPPQWF
jgi:diacylglycerol kinase